MICLNQSCPPTCRLLQTNRPLQNGAFSYRTKDVASIPLRGTRIRGLINIPGPQMFMANFPYAGISNLSFGSPPPMGSLNKRLPPGSPTSHAKGILRIARQDALHVGGPAVLGGGQHARRVRHARAHHDLRDWDGTALLAGFIDPGFAPPQKPRNDGSPVNTYKHRLPMCRISPIHSMLPSCGW